MKRRFFLAASIAAMIAAAASLSVPAAASYHGLFNPASYQGNPNVTISAIDSSGGIVCSRTSGQTPFFLMASASAIAATGSSLPYEDLSYSWNFGDVAGGETFVRPTDGVNINANLQQGPEAAYVYRNAGTYTVTLTIVGKNSRGYTTATITQTITVTGFNASGGFRYIDQVNGNDSWDGQTPAFVSGTIGPKQSIAAINAGLGSNQIVHLAKGSHWVGSTGVSFPNGGSATGATRIDAYGSGAVPIVEVSSGTNAALSIVNGGSSSPAAKSDIVISGVQFLNSGSTTQAAGLVTAISNASATVQDIYLDNCQFVVTALNLAAADNVHLQGLNNPGNTAKLLQRCGLWNCTLVSPQVVTVHQQGIYWETDDWTFFVAGSISGGTNAAGVTLDHHIYPSGQSHNLFKWINFSTSVNRNYCINTNANSITGNLYLAQYTCISECNLTGTQRAHDAGQSDTGTGVFTSGLVNIALDYLGNPRGAPIPSVGHQVVFLAGNGVTMPGNINAGQFYFVVASPSGGTLANTANIQISATLGGAAITPNSSSSGTVNMAQTLFKNFVAEKNAYGALAGDGVVLFFNAMSQTIRDARIWGGTGGRWYAPDIGLGSLLTAKLYRNKLYYPSGAAGEIFSFPQTGFTQQQQITDNVAVDARTVAKIASVVFANQQGVSIIDRNQYYAPNDVDQQFLLNATTSVAFGPSGTSGTWQNAGFDLAGSVLVANPAGWTVPPTKWSDFG